jgi:hypothetical protein
MSKYVFLVVQYLNTNINSTACVIPAKGNDFKMIFIGNVMLEKYNISVTWSKVMFSPPH